MKMNIFVGLKFDKGKLNVHMKAHIGLLVILITMFCLPLSLVGQTASTTHADSSVVMRFRIYYPVNKTDIHEDYMDNATQLHHIRKYLEKSPQIDSITIYSYASPEGSYALNKRLARERGKTAKQYLMISSYQPKVKSNSRGM